MGGLKVGRLFAELHLDKKGFDGALRSAGRGFGGLGAAAAKGMLVVGAALAAGAAASVAFAANFQAQMANVHTLIGPGSESEQRIRELNLDVKDMAIETGKSLEDLSGGLYQVISAFGDTADSTAILKTAAQASTAGLATTTDAVNLLSGVTKGYGDTSKEAVKKASDLAFQTVKLGQTTFPELAASMGKAIPLAKALGVSQEELFGSMATLTGVTGNTAEVSTQLRATFQAIVAGNPKMVKAMRDLGYESGQAMIEQHGLAGTLDILAESTGGNTVQLREMFGSVEAVNAVLALTGPQADAFAEKTAAMGEASGATAEAFEIQQATVSNMMARVQQAVGVLLVSIGEQLLPVFQGLLEWVLANMPMIQAAMESAAITIGEAFTWLVENVWPLLVGAFQFLTEQVIPPLVSAFMWVVEDVIPAIQSAFTSTAEDTMPILAGAFDFITTTVIPAIAKAIQFISEEVVPRLQAVFSAIVGWVKDNWPTISSVVGQVAGAVGTAFTFISNIIKAVWPTVEAVAKVLFPAIGAAATVLFNVLDVAFKAIGGVFEVFGAVAKLVFEGVRLVWGGIADFFEDKLGGVGDAFKGALNFIIDIVNGFIGFLNNIQIDIPRVNIPGTDIGVGGGSIDPFNINTIPHLAKGIRGFGGGLALVGERGPEVVAMPRGADVFSNRESRGLTGSGSREYNIYGVQPGDVMREVMRAERRLAAEWGVT